MVWLGFLFTLGIPLASLFLRITVILAGGYKMPIAWTISYYSALSVTFTSAFAATRNGKNLRNRTTMMLVAVFLSICFGSALGLASAEAGLGETSAYPLQGHITFEDAVACAGMGAFSGLGLGLGNANWVQVLADREVNLKLALALCLSVAIVSVSVALSVALFL